MKEPNISTSDKQKINLICRMVGNMMSSTDADSRNYHNEVATNVEIAMAIYTEVYRQVDPEIHTNGEK